LITGKVDYRSCRQSRFSRLTMLKLQ